MNAEEGMTLTKMAVTVLLIIFVIGAVLSLFYWLYLIFSNYHADISDSVNATAYERVYELIDMTRQGDYPLTTNVANMLDSFNSTDLIYVQVYIDYPDPTKNKVYVYTYKGVTVTAIGVPPENIYYSDVPTSFAMKELLRHSDRRCTVDLEDVPSGSITYQAIVVRVKEDEIW